MQYFLKCILTIPLFLIYCYVVTNDPVQWDFFHVICRHYRSLQKEGKSLLQGICLLNCVYVYKANVVSLWTRYSSQSIICLHTRFFYLSLYFYLCSILFLNNLLDSMNGWNLMSTIYGLFPNFITLCILVLARGLWPK